MSQKSVRKNVVEKSSKIGWFKTKENPNQNNNHSFFKNFKKVYPLGIHRSNSSLSVSSISLSTMSQTSTDSSLTDYSCPLDHKILLSLESLRKVSILTSPHKKDQAPMLVTSTMVEPQLPSPNKPCDDHNSNGVLKRCLWITKSSGKNTYLVYFHL